MENKKEREIDQEFMNRANCATKVVMPYNIFPMCCCKKISDNNI